MQILDVPGRSAPTPPRAASTSTAADGGAPGLPGWSRAFQDLTREHGFEPLAIEGVIPAELAGTLYRVGPSLFSSFGRRYGHWFDGDGAVSAVRLEGGRAQGAVRLVESRGLLEERRAGRRLYGGYGTPPAGNLLGRLRRIKGKNAANTSVVVWQGRLFALFEAGRPTELDQDTLATVGETDLEGVVTETFSAHPHWVPERRAAYNFGLVYGPRTRLHLYELPAKGRARRLASIPLAGPTMIHDFIATPRHLVFFAPPLRLSVLRLLAGGTVADSLAWRPELGTEVLVVPIDEPTRPVRFEAPAFYQWHFANAFERDGRIVVDLVRYTDFATNRWLAGLASGRPEGEPHGGFHRVEIDPAARTLRDEARRDASCEFPRLAPSALGRPYRFAYVTAYSRPELEGRGLFDAVARLDVETGRAQVTTLGEERYPSEPVFVPRPGGGPGEDDGWLLTLVYDARAHASHVAVLDARTLEVLGRAHFDHHLPFTFHGNWAARRAR